MFDLKTQQAKADTLRKLHQSGQMLVLPNIWNPLGAAMLQDMGYAAIATASAAIAFTNGYDDGEYIPFDDLLHILTRIAASVDAPVTADIETGFADNDEQLAINIRRLIEAGIVGINIEDTDKNTGELLPVELQSRKIELIGKVSADMGIALFINARTDVYIRLTAMPDDEKLAEAIKRGIAYKNAGAGCIFPIAVANATAIGQLVAALNYPVNIIAMPGGPSLQQLRQLGVARVSFGPGFLKIAMQAMQNFALKLKDDEGMDDISNNAVTSAYLKKLALKNQA